MHDAQSRRSFLGTAAAAGFVALPTGLLIPKLAAQMQQSPTPPAQGQTTPSARPPRPPALAPAMVRDFVGAAHGNLERTKEMLAAEPGLLNATWDWGGGDFEMAIGGAGHMGRKDIALFLVEQGGRMDIFVAAMLSRRDILEPTLKAFPHLVNSKGPHTISLLRHAKAGGAENNELVAYLESLGAK